jgi:hypothetical protein
MYRWLWKCRRLRYFFGQNTLIGPFEVFFEGAKTFFGHLNCPERNIMWAEAWNRSLYYKSSVHFLGALEFVLGTAVHPLFWSPLQSDDLRFWCFSWLLSNPGGPVGVNPFLLPNSALWQGNAGILAEICMHTKNNPIHSNCKPKPI